VVTPDFDMQPKTPLRIANTRTSGSIRPVMSIVTCSFQHGRYLEQTIRSVLDQGYAPLEYIIIDGGSTDNSVDIIRRHESALAYWVSEADHGQTDALIKGFKRATGDIRGWLCSDDLLLPGALQAVGDFFSTHPDVMAVYGDALWIDAEGRFLRPKKEMGFNRFVLLHDHNYIPQPSMFWRHSLYEAVSGLDLGFDLAMDADLWQRFSGKTKVAHIPRYLSCMRFYPEQKTRSRKRDGRREDEAIRTRAGAKRALPAALLRLAARCVRVSAKALAGGYTARVPREHLAWLEQGAAGDARK
jgi:glycosyltransferase involved in cell wall biosynthesis